MQSISRLLRSHVPTPTLRIGVDLDGTLMKNDPVWAYEFAHAPCVSEIPHTPVSETATSQTYDFFKDICAPCLERCLIDPRVLLAHAPLPGALETIQDLSAKGVEFHVVTARPEEAYESTVQWLKLHGFYEYFASINFTHEKRKACKNLGLDVLIDDSHYVYDDMHLPTKSTTRLLFMHATHNRNHPATERFHAWNDIHQELLEMFASELAKKVS